MNGLNRKSVLSVAGVAAVLLACVTYLLSGVLEVPLTGRAAVVTVEMKGTGGLFKGSNVSYRGVVVGKVTDLDLTADGVDAKVRLKPGADIPRDSVVKVRSLSPVGEQYLDFQPRSPARPFLADGDHISATSVDLPATVAGLATSLDRVMSQVNTPKLQSVISQLDTGLQGSVNDLQRLLDSSLTLTRTAHDNVDVLTRLLVDGRTVLQVGADKSAQIRAATASYAVFARWLRTYMPEVEGMLNDAPAQIERLRKLLAGLTGELPAFLDAQGSLDEILAAHDPHIRELLQEFPTAMAAFARTFRDGAVQFDGLLRRGPLCKYPTKVRTAHDTTFRELQDGGFCSTAETGFAQRGAQFAPGPVG